MGSKARSVLKPTVSSVLLCERISNKLRDQLKMRVPATHPVDVLIINLDRVLHAVAGGSRGTGRAYPAQEVAGVPLDDLQRRHAAGLMRVNHAGEVAAQALYHAQSLTARSPRLRRQLSRAADEESDHLRWCRRRLTELGSRPSVLDPCWYFGSFVIGVAAGVVGDRANLGFLAETEQQVVTHLESHLQRLPAADARSLAVVRQMRDDEQQHAHSAEIHGAVPMPGPVKRAMGFAARLMTTSAYWF